MSDMIVCWRCGESLKAIPRPITRLAQCKSCDADLHVCRLCRYYNPRFSERCDHDLAEPAREIDVANFCHYFKLRPNAYNSDEDQKAKKAMNELKALFGDDGEEGEVKSSGKNQEKDPDSKRFDDLFK